MNYLKVFYWVRALPTVLRGHVATGIKLRTLLVLFLSLMFYHWIIPYVSFVSPLPTQSFQGLTVLHPGLPQQRIYIRVEWSGLAGLGRQVCASLGKLVEGYLRTEICPPRGLE